MTARARLHATLVAAVGLVISTSLHAQSHASDVATAQALFDEARTLVKAGKYAEACPKFEESERLDSGPGTEFNLADCYQRAGRTASAWAEFLSVADSLHAAGQRGREKVARDRATALEPKVARLTINVPASARVAGLEIKRDSEVVREAQWGTGVAVDPGQHTISAAASGMAPWQKSIDVTGEGKTFSVNIPTLSATPAAQTTPQAAPLATPQPSSAPATAEARSPQESEPARGLGGRRIAALVAAGVGLVGIGVGSYFGVEAFSKHGDYVAHCPNDVCDPAGIQLHNDAASAATASTIAMTAGAVLVAGGAVLWLTAPPSGRASGSGLRLHPAVGVRSGGLSLEGAW
jgi:hypothetical protein